VFQHPAATAERPVICARAATADMDALARVFANDEVSILSSRKAIGHRSPMAL
jgi:hypothetical protein